MEMIIPSVWVVLGCTINHLSLNLQPHSNAYPSMLAEAWKKPAALERLLHRRCIRPVTELSCLSVLAWASKTTTCFNQPFSGLNQEDFMAFLVSQESLPWPVGITWNCLWQGLFPALTFWWGGEGLYSGSGFPSKILWGNWLPNLAPLCPISLEVGSHSLH